MPSIDVMCRGLDIPPGGLGCRLLFDLPQHRAEPGNIRSRRRSAIASHGKSPTWGKDRYGVAPQPPVSSSLNRWATTCAWSRVDSYGDSRRHREHEITVGALDDLVADELDWYGALQGAVALVILSPLLRELPDLACRIDGFDEVHPVCAGRQLVSEGMERRGPGDGGHGRDYGLGTRIWCSVPADRNCEWHTGPCMPFRRGLPARWIIFSRRHDEARRPRRAGVNPEYACFQEQPVEEEAGELEPPPEGCYRAPPVKRVLAFDRSGTTMTDSFSGTLRA